MSLGVKIAEGREAEVYAWAGGAAVVKLYRPGFGGHVAETAALSRLDGHGVAPGLIGAVDLDGRHGLVLERLDGSDMLASLERQPWRLPELARRLAETHTLIGGVAAPADLPDLRQVLTTRIEAAVVPPELRGFALRVLDQLPSGDRLCHGDFHPGNVLVTPGGGRVIDWANAARGVPVADYARTMLLLRRADPLPGTSLLFRGLLATGRSAFARRYALAYRRSTPDPLADVDSWTVVQAAARLAEGITQEQPKLIAFLDRARRKAMR